MSKYLVYIWNSTRVSTHAFPKLQTIAKWEAEKLEDVCEFLKHRKIPYERVNTRKLGESFREDFLLEFSRLSHQPFIQFWRIISNENSIHLVKENERELNVPNSLSYAWIVSDSTLHLPYIKRNRQGYACTSEQYKRECKKEKSTKEWKIKRTYRRVNHRAIYEKDKAWINSEINDYYSILHEPFDESETHHRNQLFEKSLTGEVENWLKYQGKRKKDYHSCWDLCEKVKSQKSGSWKNQKKKHQYE